jgi:competence protein ComEC
LRPVENASAARTCLAALVVGAFLSLVVCVIAVLTVAPIDILPQPATQPPDRRGEVEVSTNTLTVTVMDVGQGLSVVILAPDGTSMVYDAGRSGDRVEDILIPYLEEIGVTEIDYLIVSHPHQDHIGGMPRLLDRMTVRNFVDPAIPTTNQTYGHILERVIDSGINPILARAGASIDMGPGVSADVLWPRDPFVLSGGEPDPNENSTVIQIRFGDVTFLLTGDIEQHAERAIIEMLSNDELQSDVIVVAHHGGRTSSSAAFLDAVSPSVAVIPVGLDNQYGHPHDEVMQRLRFRGITIHRTDLDGTVEMISDGEQYTVTINRTTVDGN